MAPLPFPYSQAANAIENAIWEGRAEEALHKIVHALRQKPDDRAVRHAAANWIERIGLPPGAQKRLRNGNPELPEDWLDISQMFDEKQGAGRTYAAAVAETAAHFGCSVRHVQNCVAEWRRASAFREEQE